MKAILSLTLVLAVVAFALIGVLTISGVLTIEDAIPPLLKSEAVILFVGGCSMLLVKLASNRDGGKGP